LRTVWDTTVLYGSHLSLAVHVDVRRHRPLSQLLYMQAYWVPATRWVVFENWKNAFARYDVQLKDLYLDSEFGFVPRMSLELRLEGRPENIVLALRELVEGQRSLRLRYLAWGNK